MKVRAVRDRREHLGTIATAERHRAGIRSGLRRRLLEQVAEPSPRRTLDLGRPPGKHHVHDARQHPLVLLERGGIARCALDQTCQREAAPLLRALKSEWPWVLAVRGEESHHLLGTRGFVAEGLISG